MDPIVIPIRPDFAALVSQLSTELIHLLDAPIEGMDFLAALSGSYELKEPPADPLLRQLLPDMSEDPVEALELRSFTEDSLRLTKTQRLQKIVVALQTTENQLSVPQTQAWDWLSSFNDLRLYLGMRLAQFHGSTDLIALNWEELEAEAERLFSSTSQSLTSEEIQKPLISLAYLIVSWWQESLLQEVIKGG